jgi:hypothetical protein
MIVSSCGDGTWNAQAWSGSSFTGDPFNDQPGQQSMSTSVTPISCGSVACGGSTFVPDSLDPNTIAVVRGIWDKNGNQAGACSGIPYYFTNNLDDPSSQFHFRWALSGAGSDGAAAFKYSVIEDGPAPATAAIGVAWFNQDGTDASLPGTPDFIAALDCDPKANFLPQPYGTLDTTIMAGDLSLTIDGVAANPGDGTPALPATPFSIVIVNNDNVTTERITAVTQTGVVPPVVAGYAGTYSVTYTVTRGGNTEGDPNGTHTAPHAGGVLVMSTPLPIMTSVPPVCTPVGGPYTNAPCQVSGAYKVNTQAQACVSTKVNNVNGTHTTTFIDVGDGWGTHP